MKGSSDMGRRDFMALAGVAAGAFAARNAWSDAGDTKFREVGRFPLSIKNPSALAVGEDDALCVAGENAVIAMNRDGTERFRFPVKGRPGCLVFSPAGKLIVGIRSHVETFDLNGKALAVWKDLGERAYLTSIAADDENAYLADAGNRVVLHCDHEGKSLGRIGERDKERDIPGLVVPSPYFDVAIDPMGALWVVNPGMHGLENYRPDGDLVSSWYRSGMEMEAFCGCCNPIHIAFRSDCTLVTAEKGLNRIKVYSPDTSLYGVVSEPPATPVSENKALFCNVEPPIMDLAVDSKDRILVLNKPEKAVVVYEEVKAE